ncbi:hypothetical protein [Duganella vulcania]|uniref:Uncharacterized protein n=1 Tax=Duganella vulcania TaxID=2692166 RepID=A0A845GDR5_9BURK|nr:hypothetical protein [Duganella vulcania]MYM92763.1 hypothetical protein [Duganella vulcania]
MKKFFELVLKGFDGSSDATDHLILWVKTSFDMDELVGWLIEEGLYGDCESAVIHAVLNLPDVVDEPGLDFDLPLQAAEFKLRVSALCAQPIEMDQ